MSNASGSLSEFADEQEYGFSKKKDGTIVYKEWMPACNHTALVGDFNGRAEKHEYEEQRLGIGRVSYRQGRFRTIRE